MRGYLSPSRSGKSPNIDTFRVVRASELAPAQKRHQREQISQSNEQCAAYRVVQSFNVLILSIFHRGIRDTNRGYLCVYCTQGGLVQYKAESSRRPTASSSNPCYSSRRQKQHLLLHVEMKMAS